MIYDVVITSVSGKLYKSIFNDVAKNMSGLEIANELCGNEFIYCKSVRENTHVLLNVNLIETIELVPR